MIFASLILAGCAATKKRGEAPTPGPETPGAVAAAALDEIMSIDDQVTVGKLENGLRYVIRRNEKPENRAELRLSVNVGSVLEEEEQQGLAHFTEHMAFDGTAHFAKQELIDYLESIGMRFGADLNAYTSFDETVYMLTVPTDSVEVMRSAFQIFEDWAYQVSFEEEEIEKERGVVVEEWRLGRGAQDRLRDQQLPVILKDSRYAERLPIGQKAVLDTFHHEVLRDFYRTWYRPELMGFVAVGDFDPQWMESLVHEYLSRIPTVTDPSERVLYPVPGHEETLFAIATDPEAASNSLTILYKQDVREQQTVGSYRQSLMEGLYHSMFNQRLYELTQVADPPYLGAFSGQGRWVRTKEVFMLGAGVADNGFDRGLEALLTEAARIRRFGFTRSELAREKKNMLRGMEQAYRERDKSQSSGFAAEYVRHLLEDEPIPGVPRELELHKQLLPTIELAEVNEYASEWTSDNNRVITLDAPEKSDLQAPTEEDLLAVFARVAEKEITAYEDDASDMPLVEQVPEPADIVESGEIPEIGVTTWTLANGVRVFLKPTDFKNDEILFEAYSLGGNSLTADEDYMAAATASTVVGQGGVAGFNQVELGKVLAGKVVGVSPWISDLQEGLSGSASPDDLVTMFELIYAYVTTPREDSTAFQSFTTRIRGFIENRDLLPETAYSDTVQVTMAQYHHRERPLSMELLEEMDLSKSMAVYRDRFADAGDFTFFFVGNFTLEGIEPLVRTYLGGLPSTGREERWRDVGIEAPKGVVEKTVYRGIEPKSQTSLIFTGPFEYDGWRNNFELDAMTSVLQIKLREVMREDLGGTYGVSVGSGASHYPNEDYRITLRFGSDPKRTEELTRVVFEQIDSLRTFGTTEEYVTKVREMRKREREVALKENGFWVGGLQMAHFNGIDPRLLMKYGDMVDSLTVEVVQAAARKYFDTGNYVHVTLLPEAAAGGEAAGGE
jgi:zinc protease